MKSSRIELGISDGIATLTLNRPEKNNAVDGEMMRAIAEALEEISAEREARILLLRAAGNHFCAGREPGASPPRNAGEWSDVLGGIMRANRALVSFPGISMAIVQGRALGFGCGLAVQSDITLASDDARFAFPEIKAGFPPTIVMSYLGRWISRKKAFELVITGAEIDAVEAERLGLVNRIVPGRELAAEAKRWTDALDKLDARALAACKTFFRDTAHLRPEDAAGYGISLLANFMSSRRT